MLAKLRRLAAWALCAALVFQAAACGTIMHPERKGQRDGDIDAGVAVLDAVGLLFFIIPGVIAFAVDFSNGTIYFPGGRHKQVDLEPRGGRVAAIERALREETGRAVRLDQPGVQVSDRR